MPDSWSQVPPESNEWLLMRQQTRLAAEISQREQAEVQHAPW